MSKRVIKTTAIFNLTRSHQNMHDKVTLVFPLSCIKKYTETMLTFCQSKSGQEKYIKTLSTFCYGSYAQQSSSKRSQFFGHRNNIDESTSKHRWFLAIEITSKKYFEIMWKFIDFCIYIIDVNLLNVSVGPLVCPLHTHLDQRLTKMTQKSEFHRLKVLVGTND